MATTAPITLQSVFELVREDLLAIEREFGDDTASEVEVITEIGEYLRNGGGKRIRPALLLLSAKLCGYEGRGAIRLGAVVEINADRGQWQVLLSFDGMTRFHMPESWAAYLDGVEMSLRDVDYQAAFVRERGAEAAAAVARDPEAERKLIEAGRAYMERWYQEGGGG